MILQNDHLCTRTVINGVYAAVLLHYNLFCTNIIQKKYSFQAVIQKHFGFLFGCFG